MFRPVQPCAAALVVPAWVLAAPAAAQVGPDVTYQDVTSVANQGAVGGIRAYVFDSYTCNRGTANLRWGGSWQGSPALAMNLYRLHDGRLEQIGMSWCKQACCAGSTPGCGSCNGVGGSLLGAGCLDVYTTGWNATQGRLGARSEHNAFTGAMTLASTTTGNAIFKRLQVVQTDLDATLFPGALYFGEGVYVASDDAPGAPGSGNPMNNASHRRMTVAPGTYNISVAGATSEGLPAIHAWRNHGGGVGVVDPSVLVVEADVPSEGRFWVAGKARDLGGGLWRYDYAVFNLNSDRSAGSFSVPVPPGVTPTGIGFRDVDYHSGEPYDNTDWGSTFGGGAVTWASPQTFAQNPNSNALRWGTMYNFWFTAAAAPAAGNGSVTIGLFKPHIPQAFTVAGLPVPGAPPCPADFNMSGEVTVQDIFDFLEAYFSGSPAADFNGVGGLSVQDIFDFLDAYFGGCT